MLGRRSTGSSLVNVQLLLIYRSGVRKLTIIADMPSLLSRRVNTPARIRIMMMTGMAAMVVQNSASLLLLTTTTTN